MKKKILITIGIILAAIIAIIAYFVITDLKQEEKLKQEMSEISELIDMDNLDDNTIQTRLARTVTKGDYAVVEKSFKTYLSDVLNNIKEMANILNDENLAKSLTAKNYQEDGPNFVKTKEYLATTKAKLETSRDKYYEYFSEEKAMSYIKDKNLDEYYINLYKDEIVGDIESEKNDKSVENSINEIITLLDTSEEIINFLSSNQGSWQVENDSIVFSTQSLTDQYNELISSL